MYGHLETGGTTSVHLLWGKSRKHMRMEKDKWKSTK
jgi:hypothetical protein